MRSMLKGQVSLEFLSYYSALFMLFLIIVGIVFLSTEMEFRKLLGSEIKEKALYYAHVFYSVMDGGKGYVASVYLMPTSFNTLYNLTYCPKFGILRLESKEGEYTARLPLLFFADVENAESFKSGNDICYIFHSGSKLVVRNEGHYLRIEVKE